MVLSILNDRAKLHAEGLNNVKFVRLDVTDSTTIDSAKEIIEKAEGKLDVLVNNAGMSRVSHFKTIMQYYRRSW